MGDALGRGTQVDFMPFRFFNRRTPIPGSTLDLSKSGPERGCAPSFHTALSQTRIGDHSAQIAIDEKAAVDPYLPEDARRPAMYELALASGIAGDRTRCRQGLPTINAIDRTFWGRRSEPTTRRSIFSRIGDRSAQKPGGYALPRDRAVRKRDRARADALLPTRSGRERLQAREMN